MQKVTYRYQMGDILRLRRSSPLATAGDYVLRSVDNTVCLSRLVQTARGRRLSRKRLYMLITDLCVFQETGRRRLAVKRSSDPLATVSQSYPEKGPLALAASIREEF